MMTVTGCCIVWCFGPFMPSCATDYGESNMLFEAGMKTPKGAAWVGKVL